MNPSLRRRGGRCSSWVLGPLGVIVAAAALVGFTSSAAVAHEPGATLVSVAEDGTGLTIQALVPLDRFDFAYGTRLADAPELVATSAEAELRTRLETGVSLTSPDGATWATEVGDLNTTEVNGVANLAATITATPPPDARIGTGTGTVDLRWTLITDTVYSHQVYVVEQEQVGPVISSDVVGTAQIVGIITTQDPVLRLSEGAPAARTTFTEMIRTGFLHFREGPDHLLFLCLVALGAAARRPGSASPEGSVPGRASRVGWTLGRLALLTLAFTVGHSISLALATLGLVTLPGRWVETAIAVTIVLTAAHAVRPWFTSRAELLVTGGFGVVHGFGFAGTLADLSVRGTGAVVPLLGFNLGLEAAQVAGLLLVGVPLVVLATSRVATRVVAGLIGAVAGGWIAQRALGLPDFTAPVVEALASPPEVLALVLAAGAVLLLAHRRRLRGPHRDDRQSAPSPTNSVPVP